MEEQLQRTQWLFPPTRRPEGAGRPHTEPRSVGHSDSGQANVGRLCERLVVGPGSVTTRVSAPGSCPDVVSEGSRAKWSANFRGSSELQHSWAGRCSWTTDVTWFPGKRAQAASRSIPQVLSETYDADAVTAPFADGLLHLEVKAGAT